MNKAYKLKTYFERIEMVDRKHDPSKENECITLRTHS